MNQIHSLQDEAYQYLKSQISDGNFESGIIYSLNATAAQLNISRTPVRDALNRLSQEGFIEILPSRGFRLLDVSEREILEIYQLRYAIEGFCCYELSTQILSLPNHPALELLKNNLDQQAEFIKHGGPSKDFLALDHAFHTIIINAVNNQQFHQIFNINRERISKLILRSLNADSKYEATLESHQQIYSAIATGSPELSQKVMWDHLHISRYDNLMDVSK